MRVQVIYGEYTEADLRCAVCRGSGVGPAGNCWFCHGAGTMAGDMHAYTYDAPDGTGLWQVLITPTQFRSGQRGTVVQLGSPYDGPVREAFPLPATTAKCLHCGATVPLRQPFCGSCWAHVPDELRERLRLASAQPGTFAAVLVQREIGIFLVAYLQGREDGAREQVELMTPDPWRESVTGFDLEDVPEWTT